MVRLSFKPGTGTLDVVAPPNGNIAPPGYYMLFVLNSTGVPSVARFVRLAGEPPPPPPPPAFPIRINTGGAAFTDAAGHVWSADQAFSGGATFQTAASIAGTVDDALYQSERWCISCSYSITVPNGNYEVVLHFAEITWSSANQRVFDVSIEGTPVIDNLDLVATVGSNAAFVQTFPATVSDGTLTVNLGPAGIDAATIAAIEVRLAGSEPPPPPPPPAFPIRINTGGAAFTDAAGHVWSADQAFSGGATFQTAASIAGTVDDALYQSERWCTSCSYSITVPNGNYEVVLHFAEITWSSANQRVFDVSIEGTPVIDNLDLVATVGSNTAFVQTFPATVSDGSLTVNLGPAGIDAATIAAIEVRLAGSGPPPPTALVASAVSASQINLTWTDNANNETGYVVERCQGAGCSTFTGIATLGANVTSYNNNTGLTASTPYSYRVAATIGAATSGYSNTASATTQGTTPAAPSGLNASAVSASQINLTWTDNANNETGYVVERCQGAGCSTFTGIATLGANVTSYNNNTGLTASTPYSYRVAATIGAATSGYSNTASATTQGTTPAAPSGLNASAVSASQINLTWTDNANNETGYVVERCQGAGCSTFTGIATLGANVTSYNNNTGLTASTPYSYRVAATIGAATSGYSNTASATTQGTTPAAPSGLNASAVSASQINLTWTDNANNETGYVVERCQGAGCSTFTGIATLGANVTSYNNNTGLTASTPYSYRVAATIGAATSGYSNTASATTQAASGLQLAVTGYKVKGMQHADLTWSGAASANVDIYRNNALISTTPNDAAHTDVINTRGGGSYTYRVCEAGTATCSNNFTITF